MHLDRKKILAYVAGVLSDEKCFEIDSHLAKCEQCAKRVKGFYHLRTNPDNIFKRGSPKKLAENVYLGQLRKSLGTIAKEHPHLKNRIEKWLAKISLKMEVAFGFILDSASIKVQPVLQITKALLTEGSPPLNPVPAPSRVLGTRVTTPLLSVEAKSDIKPRITIDPAAKKVLVQIAREKGIWPIAVLFSVRGNKVFVGEFWHPEGTDFILTEFEGVPDGEYVLVLEPRAQDGNREILGDPAGY